MQIQTSESKLASARLTWRRKLHATRVLTLTANLLLLSVISSQLPAATRITRGLQVLYTFDAGSGATIHDRSGTGQPLNLKIEAPASVEWQEGALLVRSSTKIISTAPARTISDVAKRSGAITIEAWVRPANDKQEGPARIVTLSADNSQRNFTLGQLANLYDVRLRTAATSTNGIPSTATEVGTADTGLAHLVYTRDTAGNARIYINGRQQASKKISGSFANWNDNYRLALANEMTGERPWLGTFYLVAVYSRGLTAPEVTQNFKAGARASIQTGMAVAERLQQRFFETRIAPLLANNCLDCHDSSLHKGKLDLSRKLTAMAGGENGKVIVPGKSAESPLWKLVDSGDMPAEGDPLSAEQKKVLKQWIDAGATWSLDRIDPAVYLHNESASTNWVRRLTLPEYIETVRSAVGVDISKEARELLPADLRADGFSNTAYNLNVDLQHIEAYSRLAETIVGRMEVLKFAGRFSKSRSLSTDDTMREFVAAMGQWLLRGPLDEREVTNYSGIATTVASAGGDYEEAVNYICEAMLQSPRFIYRVENQLGDGTAWPVNDYELASRMSYIIWGGPPDQELMRAASAGELQDRGQATGQLGRMLEDPRAIEHSVRFVAEWLNLERLGNLQPNKTRFPNWDAALAADMRQETLAFFKDLAWKQNRPLSELLNAQFTYATPRLAKHYGLEPKESGLVRYDLSSIPARGGLLTQGSVLTVGGDDASMVTRGLFVFHDALRGTVKSPPAGIDTTPVPSKPGLSQRRIAEQRIANLACAGCHSKFEPLAFGLERFDGLGAYHEKDEHGNKLRDDGEIFFPGTAKPVKYKSSAELMDLLAESDRIGLTITWKVTQFALGRPLGATDAPIIERIHQAAKKNGGTYASLITAIVMSDLVQTTQTEQP